MSNLGASAAINKMAMMRRTSCSLAASTRRQFLFRNQGRLSGENKMSFIPHRSLFRNNVSISSSSSSSYLHKLQYHENANHQKRFKNYNCINDNSLEKDVNVNDNKKEDLMSLILPSLSKIQNLLCDDTTKSKSNQNQSIYNTLLSSIQLFEKYNAPEPTSSACHLLSFALKDDFQWEDNGFSILYSLLENPSNNQRLSDKVVTEEELYSFSQMIQRRMSNEPIQYILGQWDFHDITINIRQPCLCPRPETEELVEYVARDIKKILHRRKHNNNSDEERKKNKVRVLDVGCGTGAISIALANMFSSKDIEFVSIDVAKEAVELSIENARLVLGGGGDDDDDSKECNSSYYESFVCSAADFTNTNNNNNNNNDSNNDENKYTFGFDIVVSNPPYIPKHDMQTLSEDVVGYEDYGALCGGNDGMDVIRDIVKRLPEWCYREGEDDGVCWMEVDTSHPKLMSEWLGSTNANENNGVKFEEGLQDFYGLERFVKLQIIKNDQYK